MNLKPQTGSHIWRFKTSPSSIEGDVLIATENTDGVAAAQKAIDFVKSRIGAEASVVINRMDYLGQLNA